MDNYIVSARKYRPATFKSVIGQQALTTTLKNAITTGKLAQAYLFCGPRGVGKTTCARIFAKTINCQNLNENGEACNECESCKAFNEQRSLNIFELDAASNNSVDNIRQLVEQVHIPPQIGKYKVYIIDEVHMLSSSAFNAFLKTLEEPPRHAIFILATTEKHKILPTILSRCQIYDFSRITVDDIVAHLADVAAKEGITAEPEALNIIALKADGGMRDALSIFDQVTSFTRGHITYKSTIENLNVLDYEYYFQLTDYLLHNQVTDSLLLLNEVISKGFDAGNFITGLSSHFRDILVSKDESTIQLLEVGASIRDRYKEQARQCSLPFLYEAMKLCNECDLNYRISKNKRFSVELTLIQLAQITYEQTQPSDTPAPKTVIKPVFNKPSAQPQQVTKATIQATPSAPTSTPSPTPAPAPASGQALKAQVATPQAASHQGDSRFHSENQPPTKKIQTVEMGSLGISINKPFNQAEELKKEEKTESAKNIHDKPFTEADFQKKWLEYADNLPIEETAMKKKMQATTFTYSAPNKWEINMDNKLAANDFEKMLPSLHEFLRKELQNDTISISVIVNEVAHSPKAFTKTERFQQMAEKNKALLELKKEFELEFS